VSATRNSGSFSTILPGDHRSRRLVGWQQLCAIVAVYLLYLVSRQIGALGSGRALDNARSVVSAEHWLGLDLEHGVRTWLLGHSWLVTPTNLLYLVAHWPLIATVAFWLFRRSPDAFRALRNAMFVSGGLAFVVFASFPVSPPRFAVSGARDTVVERASWLHDLLQPASMMNEIAAMPSIHFGWNLMVCLAIVRFASRRILRIVAALIPPAMAFAVVATANHYVLDVVAGAALCAGCWVAATRGLANHRFL
jgi:hypothetical protein